MTDLSRDQRIGTTVRDSTPWWPTRAERGDRHRNVLVVLLDDVGYADFGCYGSAIATPTIDRLADDGLRYTGFHTTAMCSSLLEPAMRRTRHPGN